MTFRQLIGCCRGVLGIAAAPIVLAGLLSGCGGQTYSCGTPSANHCYGIVTWTGKPSGFSMEVTAVPLTSGDIFIDDEGWLVDYYNSGDPLSGAYWVEVGEETVNPIYYEGYGTTYYFWAENTAAGGFMSYALGAVSQSDLNRANWIAYKINQDAKTPSQWNVTIWEAATGTTLYTAASANNPMTPTTVIEGQELAGSQNAQAPLAFFSYNKVIQGSTASFRTDDGTVEADHPPNAGWWFTDKPSQTGNGGMFFTDCC